MKNAILVGLLAISSSCFASEGCVNFLDQTIVVQSAGKHGLEEFTNTGFSVTGNALSPTQPSVSIFQVSNAFDIQLTPTMYCDDGLVAKFRNYKDTKIVFLPWNKETIVFGVSNTDNFISYNPHKIRIDN